MRLRVSLISIAILVLTVSLLVDYGYPILWSKTVTIANYGTIAYSEPKPTYNEPFSWYQILKEATYYIFGFLGAIAAIIKILEYRKGRTVQNVRFRNFFCKVWNRYIRSIFDKYLQ